MGVITRLVSKGMATAVRIHTRQEVDPRYTKDKRVKIKKLPVDFTPSYTITKR